MRRKRSTGTVAAVLIAALAHVLSAAPAVADSGRAVGANAVGELTHKHFALDGRALATPARYRPESQGQRRARIAGVTPPVGTVRQWLGLDDFNGTLYRKDYTLRGVGDKVEVWAANDRAFPAGDCRSAIPNSTEITDAQAADLINQFDNNIFPKETAAFSLPPDRDGSNAQLGPDAGGHGGDYTGEGDNTVIPVDNVRDEDYYNASSGSAPIPGFFSAQFNELLDRNVITLDVFDWAHRSGANPPDEPTADPCTSRPARPFEHEATLAGEWQQLALYYTDPFEAEWINEGLSRFARNLTGYVSSTATVNDPGADRNLFCFTGFGTVATPSNPMPGPCGGPENSLNLWGEGAANEAPADVGNVNSLMLFLYDRYGVDFIARLHRDGERQGLAGLDDALEQEGATDMYGVLHDFQTMVLVDRIVGESPFGVMLGVPRSRVTTPSLRSTVNLDNPDAYDTPGAPPNGADYVLLKGADDNALPGRNLRSLTFNGAATLPSLALQWTTVSNDPDRAGDAVLFSGNANNLDASAVTSVTVPNVGLDPTLRLLAKYGAEFSYDYGYVEVSTDGGATYTPIAGDKTVDGPRGPGLNGTTIGFEPHSFDLSAYAGQTVLLSFRYVSDDGVNEGGLLIDDVTVGGTQVSDGSSLAPFDSPTEIHPVEVNNWNLRLIGIDRTHQVALQKEYDGQESVTLDSDALSVLSVFPTVVAMVAYDEPTGQVGQYAPYTLDFTEGPPPVVAPPPPPPPRPKPPPPAGPGCLVRGVVLVGVQPTGTGTRPRVRLVGTADRDLIGKPVAILRDDDVVGVTTVGQDATIRATTSAPKRQRIRDRARYRLVVGEHRSQALKATRRARITAQTKLSNGRVRVRGYITGTKRRRSLRLRRELVCNGERTDSARVIRTKRNGRFTLILIPPAAKGQSAIYRIQLRGSPIVTLPIILTRG